MANVAISNLEVGCTIVNYCKFDDSIFERSVQIKSFDLLKIVHFG